MRELFQHCGQRPPQEARLWGFLTAQTQEEQAGEKEAGERLSLKNACSKYKVLSSDAQNQHKKLGIHTPVTQCICAT